MSAKDERAREILRGFKLYPPGSGAGPGGTLEASAAEEPGQAGGARGVPSRGRRGARDGAARRGGARREEWLGRQQPREADEPGAGLWMARALAVRVPGASWVLGSGGGLGGSARALLRGAAGRPRSLKGLWRETHQESAPSE